MCDPRCIKGSDIRVTSTAALQLRRIIPSASAREISRQEPILPKPAALTRKRILGCSFKRSASISLRESSFVRSAEITLRGVFVFFCNSKRRSFRRAMTQISSSFSLRSNCRTNSLPRPLEAPVTIAIFRFIKITMPFYFSYIILLFNGSVCRILRRSKRSRDFS